MKRKCLVIGANGGMGFALVNRMLKEKYEVIGSYHNAKEHLNSCTGNSHLQIFRLDLNNFEENIFDDEKLSGITDIVFAAGKELPKNIMDCTKSELMIQYNINVFTPLSIVQMILPKHSKSLQNIVFISSTAAVSLKAENGAYALSKACLCNLVKMLDEELIMKGIRVNCIVPGWCETEMAERIVLAKGGTISDVKSSKRGNKLIHVDEIAEICMFLLSDNAQNIHGQFIGVDVPKKGL